MKKRAVFLDRDGTLNVDVGYPRDFAQVTLFPWSAEAVRRINAAGFVAVVVTNQSGVGRGFFSEEELQTLHRRMIEALAAEGARLDAVYYCPQYDYAAEPRYRGGCTCRKPATGMAERASRDFGLDLASSFMIGDKIEDVQLGLAFGGTPILVRTGYGESSAVRIEALGLRAAAVVPHLLDAVAWLEEREQSLRA
jgi:D-glycero-D-manno-heptose 1,7-bisphosphate phosphatase